MKVLVTGGAGFIGSNLVRFLLETEPDVQVVNLDALTYAGNLASLDDVKDDARYVFVHGDIADSKAVESVFAAHHPDVVINCAAESHVDRSILAAGAFVRTNVLGTQVLLEAARAFGIERFCQVSTDEVYGSLGPADPPFTETSPLRPNSPYAASKAAADLLVRSYVQTHGMDAVITRCSNNYGPHQFPEKFIPLLITNTLADEALPIYGDGQNVRDWIHVRDHCAGLWAAVARGRKAEIYNFGANNERPNLEIARTLLELLDKPESLIRFVEDRPGHDRRYAIGFAKAERELGWSPSVDFAQGLAETVAWYQDNAPWWTAVKSGAYQDYYRRQYGERIESESR